MSHLLLSIKIKIKIKQIATKTVTRALDVYQPPLMDYKKYIITKQLIKNKIKHDTHQAVNHLVSTPYMWFSLAAFEEVRKK